jgi:bacterioferritin-associated ferredoxin
MNLDDEVCLCFHVTQRKLCQFVRVRRPQRASQLSECGGAGTGCGWCRSYLEQLFEQEGSGEHRPELPAAEDYASMRRDYIRAGKGTPPAGSE